MLPFFGSVQTDKESWAICAGAGLSVCGYGLVQWIAFHYPKRCDSRVIHPYGSGFDDVDANENNPAAGECS